MTSSTPASCPAVASVAARLRAAGCVFAEDEARLIIATALTSEEVAAMVERRAAGLPLEHVLGWAEFAGLRVAVEPGVFVPRRRTEHLVERAVALARAAARPPAVVVDLCCGTGAVGAALAEALASALGSAVGAVELHAADIEPAAVRCASLNLRGMGGRVYQGDLYDALPRELRGRIDLLAANVPYVPSGEVGLLPAEARLHEPRVALDGGADGLEVMRRVTAAAPEWLAPGGHLLFEVSERQVPAAVEAVEGAGLVADVSVSQELEATVVTATRFTTA